MTILLIVINFDKIIDIKLNNILINYNYNFARFNEVQLRDYEDICMINLNANLL